MTVYRHFAPALFAAWTGILWYFSFVHGRLYVLRPTHKNDRLFSLFCFSASWATAASAALYSSHSGGVSSLLQAVRYLGIAWCFVLCIQLQLYLSEIDYGRWIEVAVWWALMANGMILAGLFFDPGVLESFSLDHPDTELMARLTPSGAIIVGPMWILSSGISLLSVWRLRRSKDRFWPALLFLLPLLGGGFDTLSWFLKIESLHAGLLLTPLAAFSWSSTLINDMTLVDAALSTKTGELERSSKFLSDAQGELAANLHSTRTGEMTATLAHELRSPLAVARTATQLLKKNPLGSSEHTDLLAAIDDECDRLNQTVTRLLDFARPLAPQPTHFQAAALAADLRARFADGVLHVSSETERLVYADRELILQALVNLVSNALAAGSPTVAVRIYDTVSIDEQCQTIFECSDTGMGMDEVTLQRSTVPLFTTRPDGNGLGLPLTQRIGEMHGGALLLRSTPGRGTVAKLIIPWSEALDPD